MDLIVFKTEEAWALIGRLHRMDQMYYCPEDHEINLIPDDYIYDKLTSHFVGIVNDVTNLVGIRLGQHDYLPAGTPPSQDVRDCL